MLLIIVSLWQLIWHRRHTSWKKQNKSKTQTIFKITIVIFIIWHSCQSSGLCANHLSCVAFIWPCCQSSCCTRPLFVWLHACLCSNVMWRRKVFVNVSMFFFLIIYTTIWIQFEYILTHIELCTVRS